MSKATEHKESKALVKVIYFPSKTLADGSHPFMLRITKDGQRKYIATGLTLHPRYWNQDKGEIRRSYPAEKRTSLEAAFREWESKYGKAADELSDADETHQASDIAAKVSTDRQATRQFKLLTYFDELVSQFEQMGSVGNRKVYRDVRNNLSRYIGEGKDVSFDQVSVKFCNGWETKMRTEGLSEVVLSIKFRTLRAVMNRAIANGYAKATSYPFARNSAEQHKFHIGKFDVRTTKRAISKEDIRKIETYQPEPYTGPYASLRDNSARLQLARDLFLFSYYCGGINFVDMAALRWSNIGVDLDNKPRLTYTRQKTGGRFSLRLRPQVLAILDRYREGVTALPTEYVFPILSTALHKTATQIHNRCSKVMGQVNQDLKIIGKASEIVTPLTTYVARHSFATALKRSGVTTALISEAMGHSDERTTQIYLASFENELIDEAFENL